jgi:hypothetical protein
MVKTFIGPLSQQQNPNRVEPRLDLLERDEIKAKRPSMWKIVFYNDDYATSTAGSASSISASGCATVAMRLRSTGSPPRISRPGIDLCWFTSPGLGKRIAISTRLCVDAEKRSRLRSRRLSVAEDQAEAHETLSKDPLEPLVGHAVPMAIGSAKSARGLRVDSRFESGSLQQ